MARRDEIRHNYQEFNYYNTLSKKSEELSTWEKIIGYVIGTSLTVGGIYVMKLVLPWATKISWEIRSIIEIGIIIIGIIGLIILIMSILAIKKQLETNFKQDLNYRKLDKSIKYISEWNNQQFSFLMKKIILNQENSEYNRIEYFIKEDPFFEKDIITVLNFLEQMAISIEYGLVDEDVLWQYFKDVVLKIFSSFEDWIVEQRRNR